MRLVVVLAALLLSLPALAGEYGCSGTRLMRGSQPVGSVKQSGDAVALEIDGWTVAQLTRELRAAKPGFRVVVNGAALATVRDGKIERSGTTLATTKDAQRAYACPENVAAALYVLKASGKL